MKMRHRRLRSVTLWYATRNMFERPKGKYVLIAIEETGYDDHNSWDMYLIRRMK